MLRNTCFFVVVVFFFNKITGGIVLVTFNDAFKIGPSKV